MKKTIKIRVFGNVQGVFFRHSTKQKADEMEIKGFTRNISDGSVEIVAQGREEDLKKFVEWAENGPEFAQVEKIDVSDETSQKEFQNFIIL